MAIGCGATCAKIILIIYNIIFLLAGLFLIGLGIWLLVDGNVKGLVELTFNGSNSKLFRVAAIILISMGALIVVISVLGFVAAIMENEIMLGIYIGFLVLIFCGLICGGVVAIVFKDRIIYKLKDILDKSLSNQVGKNSTDNYYKEVKLTNNSADTICQTSDVGYLWDWAQIRFSCCGIETGNSGYETKMSPGDNLQTMCPKLPQRYTPLSCCPPANGTKLDFGDFHTKPDNQYKAMNLVNCDKPYTAGCYDEIAHWLERYAPVLIGIGIGFAMLILFGIIFATCLCRNVGDD